MRLFFYSSIYIRQSSIRLYNSTSEGQNSRKIRDFYAKRKAIRLTDIIESDLLINKALSTNESVKTNQWGTVRSDLLKKFGSINEVNVDSQVYDICFYYNRVDQAVSYYEFLERNNYPINLNTMTTYLKSLFLVKTSLTEEEEKNVIRIFNKIKKDHEILDPKSASSCILGLSLTKQWRECLKLIEMIKFIQLPGITCTSALISAAFRNNEADLAWKLIDEYHSRQNLKQSVFTEYLNYCKKNFPQDKWEKEIEKMFFVWQKYNTVPQESTINAYAEFFKSVGYSATNTFITKKGICNHCRNSLQETTLTKGEFKILSSAILNKLIVGKDVYRNTSPEELKRYMIFLQSMKPYDVVIDGLNVAYTANEARGSIDNVLQVLDYFQRRRKRTLVVGRVHMKWWTSQKKKQLEDYTEVFYIKNMSQDDPFLLHITLMSGPDTCFVSRDFMRQHKSKIEDPTVSRLFKNWQMSRQYLYTKVAGTMKIRLIEPLQFDPSSQKDDKGWHIPYTQNTDVMLPSLYEAPEYWLCLKHQRSE